MKRRNFFSKHRACVLKMQRDRAGQALADAAGDAPPFGKPGSVSYLQARKMVGDDGITR
jgi:hypothetical protein